MRHRDLFLDFPRWGWDQRGWLPQTRDQYTLRVRQADRWLHHHRDRCIRRSDLDDLRSFLFSIPPTASSRNHTRTALVGFGHFLVDCGPWKANIALALPRLPDPPALPRALEYRQAKLVVATATDMNATLEAMVCCWLFAGLRRGESQQLRWEWIDPRWVRVRGKGNRERVMPAHERLTAALRRWRAETNGSPLVFPSPRREDRPISATWIARRTHEIADRSGVEFTPHQLRHTFATRLVELGADVRTVQAALGHASLNTTAIYLRVRPERVADAIDGLDF